MTAFKITTTTDTVCPWCYIGQRRLQKAIASWKQSHPEDTFQLHYRPFILNPAAPFPGVPKLAYFNDRFGRAHNEAAQKHIGAVGATDGIRFEWGRGKTGLSTNSHRLVWYASSKYGLDVADRAITNVYRGYFEGRGDITSPEFLTVCGVEAGMEGDDVRRLWQNDTGVKEVMEMTKTAQREGVRGVPSFEINGRRIGGVADLETFTRLFEKVSTG